MLWRALLTERRTTMTIGPSTLARSGPPAPAAAAATDEHYNVHNANANRSDGGNEFIDG